MIKEFNKLPFSKKLFFLMILFLLFFLPIATYVSLQEKNIKSKASEPELTLTPTPIKIQVTGIRGGGRSGTTTPCGGLNQRCCGSIPSCRPITGQDIRCYSGYCRLAGTVTITPRIKISPTIEIYLQDDTNEVGVGYYKPTSTPTPTPSVSPTPTPISSIYIP